MVQNATITDYEQFELLSLRLTHAALDDFLSASAADIFNSLVDSQLENYY